MVCPGTFSNGLLLVLGLHTHIARCYRSNSETVFGPDHAVAASSSSSFPFFFCLGPRDPRLEMQLAVRLAAIWIQLVIRLCRRIALSLNHVEASAFPAKDRVISRQDLAYSLSKD